MERSRRLALIGTLAVIGSLLPRAAVTHGPTTCPIRRLTGYPCPTCGMVRSWHSLVRLEPGRALRDHPFGPVALAALTAETVTPGIVERGMRGAPARLQRATAVAWFGWWASRLVATYRSRGRR